MGQIADMIINGEMCALCSEDFGEGYGFACVCEDCYEVDCGYELKPADVN